MHDWRHMPLKTSPLLGVTIACLCRVSLAARILRAMSLGHFPSADGGWGFPLVNEAITLQPIRASALHDFCKFRN